jgi:hypothetical protein
MSVIHRSRMPVLVAYHLLIKLGTTGQEDTIQAGSQPSTSIEPDCVQGGDRCIGCYVNINGDVALLALEASVSPSL